jgi:hypothetical protein
MHARTRFWKYAVKSVLITGVNTCNEAVQFPSPRFRKLIIYAVGSVRFSTQAKPLTMDPGKVGRAG